ncbi:phosphodiesterase [Cephaloticoccus capnophilus]|uniref:Phosphoesterase n=1 Tax=Cephaloticoccus capnophilus TaxID=1548208 RepID=A0A139SKZ2_9BACT|nr:metallophosphoesterase family protein [Cephaloticoccus capnophilus]KXU35219.1 phosphodiesterase [Cephaloticoccus capnophilus]
MRVAVFSDTHDRFPLGLAERFSVGSADEIWHLGDVCEPSGLVEFEQLGVPLRVVQGNCDWDVRWPLSLTLERAGLRFYLTHIPPSPSEVRRDVHAVLHGHTHQPRDEMIGGLRWLNPGSASQPRGGSRAGFAWLEVEGGRLTRWERVLI